MTIPPTFQANLPSVMFTILRTATALRPFDFNDAEAANRLCGASQPQPTLMNETGSLAKEPKRQQPSEKGALLAQTINNSLSCTHNDMPQLLL